MTAPLVLLTDTSFADPDREAEALAAAGARLVVCDPPLRDEAALLSHPQLPEAAALMVELAPITPAVLDAAPRCRLVARCGVGVDSIDLEAAADRGIWVTNVPGYATDTVADHAFALILACARSLLPTVAQVAAGGWREPGSLTRPLLLRDRRLGIVGFGAIGQALATRGTAFGMEVAAHDPWVDAEVFERRGVERVALAEVIASSDVLSLHTALTAETRNLLDATAIASMRPGAIVVNTARGGLIDEAALLDAIDAGHLRAAGLDVFAQEPLAHGHRLRSHPRVVATPHTAFSSDGSESVLRSAVVDAVVAVLGGGEPEGVVVRGGRVGTAP